MQKTPKSLRLHIGLFGRTNVGKSSFLNYVTAQDVAITSPVPGTTTDGVEKTMELLPLGPVVFLDTAGVDDVSDLGGLRTDKTKRIYDLCDVVVLLTEPLGWGPYEDKIVEEARSRKIPFLIVINKIDLEAPDASFLEEVRKKTDKIILCSCQDRSQRDGIVHLFKKYLLELCPENFLDALPLIGDLIPSPGLAVMIVPIDKEAPKGRLILPQVQALRDSLDSGSASLVVRETEYLAMLSRLKTHPDIVVCDSQVVDRMVRETPPEVKCTTFSILFARSKGDLEEMVRGVRTINSLKPGDKVLIAESCSHHAIEDDIGRVKIPLWLKSFVGFDIVVDVCSGKDYPEDLGDYKLIIHCGSCMLTRRQMLARIQRAKEAGVAITNYGLCIAFLYGILERVLSPFSPIDCRECKALPL
jgi:[FeFe] hydrogenase H-cluster maturation GTPase HydF